MFEPGMNPRFLVHVTELEEGVCDGKTQFRAEQEQPETASIHVADTLMTNDTLSCVMISVDTGIEISQQFDFVVLQVQRHVGLTTPEKCVSSPHLSSPFLQGSLLRVVWPH